MIFWCPIIPICRLVPSTNTLLPCSSSRSCPGPQQLRDLWVLESTTYGMWSATFKLFSHTLHVFLLSFFVLSNLSRLFGIEEDSGTFSKKFLSLSLVSFGPLPAERPGVLFPTSTWTWFVIETWSPRTSSSPRNVRFWWARLFFGWGWLWEGETWWNMVKVSARSARMGRWNSSTLELRSALIWAPWPPRPGDFGSLMTLMTSRSHQTGLHGPLRGTGGVEEEWHTQSVFVERACLQSLWPVTQKVLLLSGIGLNIIIRFWLFWNTLCLIVMIILFDAFTVLTSFLCKAFHFTSNNLEIDWNAIQWL